MIKGLCPKCGSSEVYSGADLPFIVKNGNYESNSIPITRRVTAELDNYVCVGCGYVETYIHNRDKLQKIREKWTRVIEG